MVTQVYSPEEEAERRQLIEELERQRLIDEMRAQDAAQPAPQPEAAPPRESTFGDRAGMLAQGATLGFGDEIASGLGAVGREVGSWVGLADEGTVADRYNERQQRVRAEREAYREAHPIEAIALEVGGGLLTGGMGAGRSLAAAGVRQVGKRMLGRSLAKASAKPPPSLLKSTGWTAAEGAVAGLGAADGGVRERLSGMAEGGIVGAGLGGVMGGLGTVGRKLVKSRVADDMGRVKDGNFTPLHLLNDGKLGEFYRNFLGRTYGGGEILREQGAPIGNRIERALNLSRERLAGAKATDRAEAAAARARAKGVQARYLDENMGPLQQEADDIARRVDQAAEDLDARKKAIAEADEAGQARVAGIEPQAKQQIDADIDNFRRTTARESLPETAEELREEVVNMNPIEARDAINTWWRRHGFAEAKAQDYAWTGGESVQDGLRKLLVERPDLMLEVGDVFEKVPGMAARMQKAAMRTGGGTSKELTPAGLAQVIGEPTHITGSAMMDLRNVFAKAANRSGGTGANTVKKQFDRIIKDRLRETGGEEAVDRYVDQISRYGTSRTYGSAVDASWKDRGQFTPDQWLTKQKVRSADQPMTEEAWQAREKAAKGLERAKELVEQQKKVVKKQTEKATGKATKGNKAEKKKLKKAKAKLAARQQAVKDRAKRLKELSETRDKMRRQAAGKVEARQNQLKRATKQARDFVQMSPPDRTSGLSSVLTTEELSMLPNTGFGTFGTIADLAGGSVIARQLARPGVQRAVAGQLAPQKWLSDMLRKGSPFTSGITQSVGRMGGLEMGSKNDERDR